VGASFLLNVPPDRRGLLHENDVASLKDFGRRVRGTFARNLASRPNKDMIVNVKGTGDVVRLREDIAQGQRVDAFAIDGFANGQWQPLAEGTSIGACRILKLPAAGRLRLRILRSSAPQQIKEFGVYKETV
jgi:alpha-L-fucosidase